LIQYTTLLMLLFLSSSISAQNSTPNASLMKFISIDEQLFDTDRFLISLDSIKSIFKFAANDSISISSTQNFYVNNIGLYARNGLRLDYENQKSFTIPIIHTRLNATRIDTLFIKVSNVDEPPIFTVFKPLNFIKENSKLPVFLGLFEAIDPDSIDVIKLKLTTDNALNKSLQYAIRGDSLYLLDNSLFNYEKNKILTFNLEATDKSKKTSTSFTVNLTDEAEPPTAILNSTGSILENTITSQVIDTVQVQDEDINDIIDLEVDTDKLTVQRIGDKSFTLSIADSSYFDFESNKELSFTIRAIDNTKYSFSGDFTYQILNINEAPTIIIDSTITTYEDSTASLFFNVYDPESSSTELFYELASDNNYLLRDIDYDLKQLDSTSYNLVLKPVNNASGFANITFSVSDNSLRDSSMIRLTVEPVNDMPTATILPIVIRESETKLIGRKVINIADLDNLPTEIDLTIDKYPLFGSLFFGDSLLQKNDFVFSYYDLITNKLAYRHNGNESRADTIDISFQDLDSPKQSISIPLTIKPVNDPPYFATNFFPIYLSESDSTSFRFIVNDSDNIPTELQVRIKSLDQNIIADSDINIQGIDFYRTLSIRSQRNNFGNATLEIEVSDGDKASTKRLAVIVKPVNDAPSMVANMAKLEQEVNTTKQLIIEYFDSDSESEALTLSLGSTNNRVLSDENFLIKHEPKNARFVIDVTAKEDIVGEGLLIIELADESKATALQMPFNVSYGNRKPFNFQVVGAEPIFRNDSLVVDFSWTPSIDPDGNKVTYSVFIESDKRDTVINDLTNNDFTFRNNGFLTPISNYSWYVKATDNSSQSSKSRYIDSTLSINYGSFVTPNFTQINDWAEILTIYPNPFNMITKISYRLQFDAQVEIAIYDLSGRKVDVVLDDVVTKGTYDTRWQPQNATSGLYICRIFARRLIDGETLRVSKSVTYLPQ